jgi:hypothetical protein
MRNVSRTSLVVVFSILIVGASCLRVSEAAAPDGMTLVESLARGEAEVKKADATVLQAQAAMIQAVSNARKAHVETMKLFQEVRSLDLDNQLKTTETFFEKRRRNEEYRTQHPRTRPTYEALVKICNAKKPERLVQSQLNGAKIVWPEVLQRGEFEEDRKAIETMFLLRGAKKYGPGSEISAEVQKLTYRMRGSLKTMVRDVHQMEYIAAKNFISGLAYEVQLPPNFEGLVAR